MRPRLYLTAHTSIAFYVLMDVCSSAWRACHTGMVMPIKQAALPDKPSQTRQHSCQLWDVTVVRQESYLVKDNIHTVTA